MAAATSKSDGPLQVTSFPLPPMQYIDKYSDEDVKIGNVPAPPPPIQGVYSVFGNLCNTDDDIIRPLETQGISRLYPKVFDHKQELKKLNRSILISYLDLLDVLIKCPSTQEREKKLQDLQLLFIHMHHLVNEFRTHQARETVRVLLELQKKQTQATAQRFAVHLEKAHSVLEHCLSKLPDDLCGMEQKVQVFDKIEVEVAGASGNGSRKRKDRVMCDLIDSLVG